MTTTDKPPEVGEIRRLRLADLDISLQTRSEIRLAAVGEYATQIGKGEQFPRPVVYEHDGKLYLASGHHRVRAYRLCKLKQVECEVFQGDPITAITAGIKANSEQKAERLTREDRHHTLRLVLKLNPDLSNRAIADIVGVSESTIRAWRADEPTAQVAQFRVGRDGRKRKMPERRSEASVTGIELASPKSITVIPFDTEADRVPESVAEPAVQSAVETPQGSPLTAEVQSSQTEPSDQLEATLPDTQSEEVEPASDEGGQGVDLAHESPSSTKSAEDSVRNALKALDIVSRVVEDLKSVDTIKYAAARRHLDGLNWLFETWPRTEAAQV